MEHDILASIPISGLAGEVIEYSSGDNEWQSLGDVSLREIDFRLTDIHNNPVDTKDLPISFRILLQS